jgi:hypothetical protein
VESVVCFSHLHGLLSAGTPPASCSRASCADARSCTRAASLPGCFARHPGRRNIARHLCPGAMNVGHHLQGLFGNRRVGCCACGPGGGGLSEGPDTEEQQTDRYVLHCAAGHSSHFLRSLQQAFNWPQKCVSILLPRQNRACRPIGRSQQSFDAHTISAAKSSGIPGKRGLAECQLRAFPCDQSPRISVRNGGHLSLLPQETSCYAEKFLRRSVRSCEMVRLSFMLMP